MSADRRLARGRRQTALQAALLFVIVLLVVQMWLLTATLESYLAGHHDVALPGFLASLFLMAVCVGIYLLVLRLDRAREREAEPRGFGPWRLG